MLKRLRMLMLDYFFGDGAHRPQMLVINGKYTLGSPLFVNNIAIEKKRTLPLKKA
ncbi:hypothetical protein PBCVKS1B_592L [Paramecium bursaria Chlorella virus KS1B]|nr:hypothetical protein PBCVKS1B_592L [Paramecium bursaria Chlorella virus KS1B]